MSIKDLVESSPGVAVTRARRLVAPPRWDTAVAVLGLLVVLALGATTDNFFTVANLRTIVTSASIVGIAALGATVILVVGGMVSMATAAAASLAAIVFVGTLDSSFAVAVVTTFAVVGGLYALLGWLIGAWAVNPIIVTIAAASLVQGLVLVTTDGALVTTSSSSLDVLNRRVGTIPVSVFAFGVLAVTLHLSLTSTRWGRRIFLVGENREAARVAGLRLGRVVASAFLVAGILTAIAGMFLGAITTNASLEVGGNLTFDAVAAALVGGASVAGGRGSALRTLAGALAVATVSDLLLLRGFDSGAQICVKGLVVLLAVVIVHLRSGEGRRA
ncbi:ABC transporter permease [Aeromicrobium ginsengisoli]|uniref:ABC transporter permease n=1 Tax=Aeromicrobium ginsengisoli TaxID=363867 RepID=A0A5M4FL42_9ACTN|nr:ABC transporter permease [Aeromicrobium ginsengisoli]KAA1400255.1 ABC transporter permease [Aeromicrobium ginsengisoli]